MRRITLWVLSTISTLVLLFSYHTSTSSTARAGTSIIAPQSTTATGSTATGSTTTGGSASGTTASGTGSTSAAATGSGSTATSGATAASETVDGSVVSTRFGNVQVQITVENGQITKSVVLQVPWNNQKDQQINAGPCRPSTARGPSRRRAPTSTWSPGRPTPPGLPAVPAVGHRPGAPVA